MKPTRAGPDRRLFDVWSLFYDQPLVQRLTYRPVHDGVLEALHGRRPRRVLDLGCGTGLLTERLRRELEQAEVVGCDYSHGMLGVARSRSRNAPWVQGDALRLPFRCGSFDAVVSTESFHWFPDQAAALSEIHRVLREEGLLLVALVHPALEGLGEAVLRLSRLVGQPFFWPTKRQMRALLVAAGFRVVEQKSLWRLPGALVFPPALNVAVRARS